MIINFVIEDDKVEVFLKRTIFYDWKTLNESKSSIFSWNKKHYSLFKVYFLKEAFKNVKFKEYETISLEKGFDKVDSLISFINENYSLNKEYFNLAFTNELSELNTNLLGIKIDRIDYKLEQKILYQTDIFVKVNEAIKIPINIYNDEEFKLIYTNEEFDKANKSFFIIEQDKDYVVFNPFNFSTNQDLHKQKLLNSILSMKSNKYLGNLIITSSLVNFKYEVEYQIDKFATLKYITINVRLNNIEQGIFQGNDLNR